MTDPISSPPPDPLIAPLATFRKPETTDFSDAWVGMEPTFATKKSIRKWSRMSETPQGEDDYFKDPYMLRTEKKVARALCKKYRALRRQGHPACMFAKAKLERDVDQWDVERENLIFHWDARGEGGREPFVVRFGMDPEVFEYSIKPVPLAWFYEERFVRFLQELVWDVPQELGLRAMMGHGGGQYSLSAKTFLQGSLLADEIAARLDHPELATWTLDFPNPDDRAFRATRERRAAFRAVLDAYWAGGFHPRALGTLTVENAYLDRGFGPAPAPPPGLMDKKRGPVGTVHEVFQTNFAFGRAVRWAAQNVHPGYWQSANPEEEGYRPDQIMRYSEGNLNRLQIAGELHVKSGKVLDPKDVPELGAPLDLSMLYGEASWESRAQMSRTSARDFVEALLLHVHHAQYLQDHPHVRVRSSLLQDQLLGEAEESLARCAPKVLSGLRKAALKLNLEASGGRMKTDWIEPETLFWAAWHALPAGEQAAIAGEVITSFVQWVEEAATKDPRTPPDPMEPHRHRIHPLLWKALARQPKAAGAAVRREWQAWTAERETYLGRRPRWSIKGAVPPWKKGG
jgi:hypothetical protein